jgi:hypothetical protein
VSYEKFRSQTDEELCALIVREVIRVSLENDVSHSARVYLQAAQVLAERITTPEQKDQFVAALRTRDEANRIFDALCKNTPRDLRYQWAQEARGT